MIDPGLEREAYTAPEPGAALEARSVSVRFGGLAALTDVDLIVPRSSVVGLIGPNGAGKTTLFGALSGLLRPNQGRVLLGGKDVTGASMQARAREGLARSFQHPELFRSLTVVEHLVLAHRIRYEPSRIWTDFVSGRGWRKSGTEEVDRVTYLIDLLGLQKVAHTVAEGIPTGISRLIEVGRAIATSPKVLLLDEPAAGLVEHERNELSDALQRVIAGEEVSLLLVEHDVEFVMNMANLVYVLDAGIVIASGDPDDVRRSPAVQSAYLGDL